MDSLPSIIGHFTTRKLFAGDDHQSSTDSSGGSSLDEEHDDQFKHDDIEGDHDEDEHSFSLPHMIFLLFVLFAAVVVRFLIRSLSTRRYKPPFTVVMGIIGLVVGALNTSSPSEGLWSKSVRYWSGVHPQFILFVLLPPLLFESAFSMKW